MCVEEGEEEEAGGEGGGEGEEGGAGGRVRGVACRQKVSGAQGKDSESVCAHAVNIQKYVH